MAYRIPSAETIRDAVRRVLTHNRGVGSLSELTTLVTEELHKDDPRYRLSADRLRRVATRMPAARITIYTRRADTAAFAERCPVCRGTVRAVRNRTLTGKDVALEVRCTECPYWTGRERRVPVRYSFHLKEWRFAHPKGQKKRQQMG